MCENEKAFVGLTDGRSTTKYTWANNKAICQKFNSSETDLPGIVWRKLENEPNKNEQTNWRKVE